MDGYIYSTSTAVKDHHCSALNHLILQLFLTVLPALDASTLWLKAQQKIRSIVIVDDASMLSCLSHELFVLFVPKSRHSENPPNFCCNHLSDLFLKLLKPLLRNVFQTLGDDFHERQFSAIN